MGIHEPKGSYADEWCATESFQDPRLDRWVRAPSSAVAIHVKRGPDSNSIFCAKHTIEIEGTTYSCPDWPISIEASKHFKLNSLTHAITIMNATNLGLETLKLKFKQSNDSLDEDPNWISHLQRMSRIEQKQSQIAELNKTPVLDQIKGEIIENPATSTTRATGTIASLIAIFLACRGSGQESITDTASASLQITVNNMIETEEEHRYPGQPRMQLFQPVPVSFDLGRPTGFRGGGMLE